MTWIETIPYEQSSGKLRKLYDQIKGPEDHVDNIMAVHSLRPHSMEGHMALYKNVLHHGANEAPRWLLEALGVLVSLLNRCEYCVAHHLAGLGRLLGDDRRVEAIFTDFVCGRTPADFDPKEAAAVAYARRLTEKPGRMTEDDVRTLRDVGWSDGEILEINQVVAYFAYANRTVLGLGVTTAGDVLGLSPSGEDWQHR